MTAYRRGIDAVRKEPMSMGLVAEVCMVSKKTVLNWVYRVKSESETVKAKALPAFKTFGGHHRVWPSDLKRFLKQNKMDIDFEFVDDRKIQVVLFVDNPESKLMLKQILTSFPQVRVLWASNPFEAIYYCAHNRAKFLALPKLITGDNFHFVQTVNQMKVDYGTRVIFFGTPSEVLQTIMPKFYEDKDVLPEINLNVNSATIEEALAKIFNQK